MKEASERGKRIRHYRTIKKMSQNELARMTGISQTQIAAVESGIRQGFGIDNIIKLADALGVSIDDLVRIEPKRKAKR